MSDGLSIHVKATCVEEPHSPTAELTSRELEMIKEHGWVMHYVTGSSVSPTGIDIHTHGMVENLNHNDLQCVAVIPVDLAIVIFHCVAKKIKEGKTFKDGDIVPDIFQNFNVKFVAATEGGRPVLRIVVPDSKGNVEKDMDEPYSLQYKDLPTEGEQSVE